MLTVGRHVGNTMAAFVMQALGCDVAALNTVQYRKPAMSDGTFLLLRPDQVTILDTSNGKVQKLLRRQCQTFTRD